MSRLTHVLRAGEAHRQARSQSGVVRTGTLAMEDMNDDVLRSILDALANGASNEACDGAKKWCALNTRHKRVCEEAGDGVWQTLTTRVFGANAPTVYAGPGNAQKNFYALCRRDRAQRYIQGNHVYNGTNETFLALLGDILAHVDATRVRETAKDRIRLVELVMRLFRAFPDEYDGEPPTSHVLRLCDDNFLYSMLYNGTKEEEEAALDLLGAYASNYTDPYDEDTPHEDRRYGYNLSNAWLLKNLFEDADIDRQLKILEIWKELLRPLESENGVNSDMVMYAREMVSQGIHTTLTDTIAAPRVTPVTSEKAINLRNGCAFVLEWITNALYQAHADLNLQGM